MDIEKLKELREETDQYRAVADDRCMSTNYEDGILALIDEAIAHQSVKSEEVAEAIEHFNKSLEYRKEHEKETRNHYGGELPTWQDEMNKHESTAIAALQAYEPWIPVSESIPIERDLQNGMVLAWSTELREWQVENWGYVEDRPDDYTHWKPLPEPPKGE